MSAKKKTETEALAAFTKTWKNLKAKQREPVVNEYRKQEAKGGVPFGAHSDSRGPALADL